MLYRKTLFISTKTGLLGGSNKVMKVKVKVAQSCPTLFDPMDYIVHGMFRLEYWSG